MVQKAISCIFRVSIFLFVYYILLVNSSSYKEKKENNLQQHAPYWLTPLHQLSWWGELATITKLKTDPWSHSWHQDSLWRRANARNVSFQFFHGCQLTLSTHLINPKVCVSLPHRRRTTVSLENTPMFDWHPVWLVMRTMKRQCHGNVRNTTTKRKERQQIKTKI